LVSRGVVPAATTGLVIVLALVGTRTVSAGLSPWPRFWSTLFFALLLWPIGIALIGAVFGRRVQLAAAIAVLSLTALQQLGVGTLPLPLVVSWSVTLSRPGDAIQRELVLPPAGHPDWERAWSRAAHAAIAICTEERVVEGADVTVSVNEGQSTTLATLERTGSDASVGWYQLPVTRAQVEARRPLLVTIRRSSAGQPARFCGGQDDPTRPNRGNSARLLGGQWVTDQIADLPLPPIAGRPPPSRYYVELRLYDQRGLPHAGVWY
jgi:hypothetical protein